MTQTVLTEAPVTGADAPVAGQNPRLRWIMLAAGLVAALVLPWLVYPPVAMDIVALALFAIALDILLGYTGLLSFGHAAFWGTSAYAAGLIGAKSWGLNSGSQSYSLPRDGSLVLGGYDQSSIDGDFHFTRDIIAGGVVNQRPCPLQITLSGLTLTVDGPKGAKSNTYAVPASKVTVCLEP